MEEIIMTNDDLDFLANTSSSNLNMILANMTSLMDENNAKVEFLENQTWFQRMSMTISGQKKMTEDDIARNHDKINLYTTQAMTELLNRNLIDHKVMLSLGNRVNELYAGQVEIKQMLGAFVSKLNEKIESIDNFHMLMEEIGQHVYSSDHKMFAICSIMSQIDSRTVHDDRKMEILKRAMHEEGIITEEETPLVDFLVELLELNDSDAGVIAMMLDAANEEYVAQVCRNVMFEFYALNEGVRKMKSKKAVASSVLERMQIDTNYAVSTAELCNTLVDVLAKNIVVQAIEDKNNASKERFEKMKEYLDNVVKMQGFYQSCFKTWFMRPYEVEGLYNDDYWDYFDNVIEPFIEGNNLQGKKYREDVNAIDSCFQSIASRYPNFCEDVSSIIDSNGIMKVYAIETSGVLVRPDEVDLSSMLYVYNNSIKCIASNCSYSKLIMDEELGLRLRTIKGAATPRGTNYDWNTRKNVICGFIDPNKMWVSEYYDEFSSYFEQVRDNIIAEIGDNYSEWDDLYDLFDRFECEFDFIRDSDSYKKYNREYYVREIKKLPYVILFYGDEERFGEMYIPSNKDQYTIFAKAYNVILNDDQYVSFDALRNEYTMDFNNERGWPYFVSVDFEGVDAEGVKLFSISLDATLGDDQPNNDMKSIGGIVYVETSNGDITVGSIGESYT